MRFSRLRPLASLQFFLPMAKPSRGSSVPFGLYRTVNILSRLRSAFLKTRLNDSLSASRLERLKRLSVSVPGFLCLCVASGIGNNADYGASLARPLARRRFNTRRPALVAMRALNPCVRARFSLLG